MKYSLYSVVIADTNVSLGYGCWLLCPIAVRMTQRGLVEMPISDLG